MSLYRYTVGLSNFRLLAAMTVIGAVLLIFEVDINLELSMPRVVEMPDAGQEYRFDSCVDERDQLIHSKTFGNIDNPDVQREILITEKERAIRECRVLYPEMRVTINEPFHFNFIDMKYRF